MAIHNLSSKLIGINMIYIVISTVMIIMNKKFVKST